MFSWRLSEKHRNYSQTMKKKKKILLCDATKNSVSLNARFYTYEEISRYGSSPGEFHPYVELDLRENLDTAYHLCLEENL